MRFDTSMQVRLEQRMKLAPRMIQSMEILQLPLLALEERIQQELVANPVLEVEEPGEASTEDGATEGAAGAAVLPTSACRRRPRPSCSSAFTVPAKACARRLRANSPSARATRTRWRNNWF